MISILAQGLGQDAALVGGGIAITLATLLIRRGFQLRVGSGNDNDKRKPGGDEYNVTVCNERHARIDGRLADIDGKLDRLVEYLIKPKR